MAKLTSLPYSEFEQKPGEPFKVYLERQHNLLADLEKVSNSLPPGEIVGAIVRFPVADGYAHYLVKKDKPLTLQHLPYADAYAAHPALIRGLRRQDILDEREYAKTFAMRLKRGNAS